MLPLRYSRTKVLTKLPERDPDARVLCGCLLLGITRGGKLRQRKDLAGGWWNYATEFIELTGGLSSCIAPNLAAIMSASDYPAPAPCSADYDAARRLAPVALGGGPEVGNERSILMRGADETRIFGVSYAAGALVKHAYVTSNPYDELLTGVEMLTPEELALDCEVTDATTRAILKLPRGERPYLNGGKELIPGWREVTFPRESITSTVVTINPSCSEGLSVAWAPSTYYTFEVAISAGGALVPLRRVSEALARSIVAALAPHAPQSAVREGAQLALRDTIMKKVSNGTPLDPLELKLQPFPYAALMSLPLAASLRRSAQKRSILSHVFDGEEDIHKNLGMLAWPAPTSKEPSGYYLLAVPNAPGRTRAGATLEPRRVAGYRRHEVNFASYDTETQELTLRLSLTRFNGTHRVRGASVGPPPQHDGPWKYCLLQRTWVAKATPAALPRDLLQRYGVPAMYW